MSARTTNLGPNVKVAPDAVLSETSAYGVLDLAGARLLSRYTTASAASTVLDDGEIMVTGITTGANATAVLAFRSGNTTYRWSSTTATVV